MARPVRKHRRRQARRRRRSLVLWSVAVLLLLVASWHYFALYRGLTGARDDLELAQERLDAAGLDVTHDDLRYARGHFRDADGHLASARRHFRADPLILAARLLPGTRGQVQAADIYLDLGGKLTEAGLVATDAGDKALRFRDTPHGGQPLTQSLLGLLDETDPEVERLAVLTGESVELRRELGDRALVPPLAHIRTRIDRELPHLANMVEQAQQTKALLPGFLGFGEGRRYLVLALNSGELLPGGGLVTAAGVMPVNEGVNGDLDFTDSTSWLTEWFAQGGGYIEPPAPLKRYLLRDYPWNLLVSNWDPDFPTWSQQALEFYELIHGKQDVDGIIAVDLTVLDRLLGITGPKTIDVEGTGPVTFEKGSAILTLESLTRHAFEPGGDRKSVIGDLASAVMKDLLQLPSDKWADAVDVVRDLGAERHIQVLSFDPREQTIVRDFRWDGRIEQGPGDYLQFNEASVASTKLNLIVRPVGEYHVELNELGDARHDLSLHYENTLPEWQKDKPPALVKNLMLDGLYGGYLRVLAPAGATNFSVEMDGQPGAVEDTGEHAGRDWFGTLLTLPAGAVRDVRLRWTVPLASRTPNEYRLYMQKQPGTDGLCLVFDLKRSGEHARMVTIEGGSRDAQGRVCLTTDVVVTASW